MSNDNNMPSLFNIDPTVVQYWREWFAAFGKQVPDDEAFAVWIVQAEEMVGDMIQDHIENVPTPWIGDEDDTDE
jgi:hypothetical protein